MGDWLRGRLAQDVANDVERGMGQDATGTSIYKHCYATVLNAYLRKSVFASQLSDHHYNQEMQRDQRVDDNPQQYIRDMVQKAFPMAASGAATQQYLCSQILEGFTRPWYRALFVTFQGPRDTVYTSLDTLVTDVQHFHKLHIQSGGSATMASPRSQQQQQPMQQLLQYTLPHPSPRQPAVGSTRSHGPITSELLPLAFERPLSVIEYNDLPTNFNKGGSPYCMGRGRNFVCGLCFTFDHTFELCFTHSGYKDGCVPVLTDPRN
jgi:hypothetical protein